MDTLLEQRFETDRGFQISREEILAFQKGLSEKANAAMRGLANAEQTERKMDEWIAFLSLMQECKLVAVSLGNANDSESSAPPSSPLPTLPPIHKQQQEQQDAEEDDDLTLTFPSLYYDASSATTSITASPPSSFFDHDDDDEEEQVYGGPMLDDGSEVDPFMHSCEDCCASLSIPTLVIGEKGVEKMLSMEDITQRIPEEDTTPTQTPIPIVSLPSTKKATIPPIDTTVQQKLSIDASDLQSPATSVSSATSTSSSTACSDTSPPVTVISEVESHDVKASATGKSDSSNNAATAPLDANLPPLETSSSTPVNKGAPNAESQVQAQGVAQTPAAKPATTTVIVKQETFRVYAGSRNSLLVPKATRHPDRNKPFAQQLPVPPCNRHYLLPQGCPAPDCKYGHDFLLTSSDLDKLRTDSKRTPCTFLMRHLVCMNGPDKCHMGHICPHGRECTYGDRCKFILDGMHDGPAILPPLQYRPRLSFVPSHSLDNRPIPPPPQLPGKQESQKSILQPPRPFRALNAVQSSISTEIKAMEIKTHANKADSIRSSFVAVAAGKTGRTRHR